MSKITVDIKALRRINPAKAMRDIINFVGNSAAKAGREHTVKVFPSAGGKFIAGGIKSGRPKIVGSEVFTIVGPIGRARKSGILPEQEEPTQFSIGGPVKRLGVTGKLAIPVSEKRGARGKVRRTPAKLLASGKGFVSQSGKAIVQRVGKKKFRVAFALARQARTPGELNLIDTVIKRAEEKFPSAANTIIEQHLKQTGNK